MGQYRKKRDSDRDSWRDSDASRGPREGENLASQGNNLDPRRPLDGIDPKRWFNLVDASHWWVMHFGKHAALDGRQTGDLFGVIESEPGAGGLIDRLGSSRSLVMEGGRARWRSFGVPMSFNQGAYVRLPAFWEVSQWQDRYV